MMHKAFPMRFCINLFRLSAYHSFLRSGFIVTGMVLLQPSLVVAHPGHDHHAPQTGIMHWLLAPTHAALILACLGLAFGFAIWKLRSVIYKSTTL
ncbi:MAG: hypothetical protein ACK5PB_15820 [Pirellula sp.]|jgi:hypothetical protein